ncbi:MAG: hypothetical protein V4663_02775 [Bacteroidota bacterium]
MNKCILGLILLPLFSKAQSYSTNKADRSLISSVEIGTALFNTKVVEAAILVGLKDNSESSTLELGYVFKRIVDKGIGHSPIYHGLRGAIEVNLVGSFGAYGTYDIIAGKRWLYENPLGSELKVHSKIHGEGVFGVFFAPKRSLLKFYVGIEPHHYNPSRLKKRFSPHKSSSINLKVKYTLDL